jgi:hypothetical protein
VSPGAPDAALALKLMEAIPAQAYPTAAAARGTASTPKPIRSQPDFLSFGIPQSLSISLDEASERHSPYSRD